MSEDTHASVMAALGEWRCASGYSRFGGEEKIPAPLHSYVDSAHRNLACILRGVKQDYRCAKSSIANMPGRIAEVVVSTLLQEQLTTTYL